MTAPVTGLLTRLLGRLPIGWLQLTHNRGRLAAAIAGVAFANVLVFMQLGFLGALISTIRLPYQALAADLLVLASDANTLQDGSPLPRQRMLEALSVPGVAAATALHYGRLDWKQPDGTVRTLDVLGVDPRARSFSLRAIERQRDLLTLSRAALLDSGTRNVPPAVFEAIAAGQTLHFEAGGRAVDVVGTFHIGGGFSADGYLVVSDQTFLKLFPQRSAGAPNIVLLRAEPGTDLDALARRLRAVLPASDSAVRTVAEAVARDQRFQTTQRPVGVIFGFGVAMGALVGIIIVYQVLSTDVADHLREYATFKAIGYGQRFFLGIVFEEAVILALLGFIPGSLVATGLYALVTAAVGLPVSMDGFRLAGVLLGTIAMCTLSGAVATRRLARAEPAALF
ncbi:ABC transporter permease DevC [Falsiroseomonas tokyonensis]|uniref:ABC transporter permease DevC n=1 Tax=Falsiroseomonas tokyonensis TaxID=430521 RepID=A0ABV7BS03_9PROT|nr:ABC transporter permease DevC [Falsiroseomonas tokyonensis]MBU8538418.1 FtsX-like permease family protein [Falsiroseomonas tokyonensis]